jgi:hypothetical protein
LSMTPWSSNSCIPELESEVFADFLKIVKTLSEGYLVRIGCLPSSKDL